MELSVVATLYKSNSYIEEFCERIVSEINVVVKNFEIILVDDGCPSNSYQKAKSLKTKYPSLKVVRLSTNVGHHKAMMVGLAQASGELIFLTDVDLEEEPENFSQFYEKFKSDSNIDCVYGQLITDKKRLSSRIFYKVFSVLSYVRIPEDYLVSRLFTKQYRDTLLRFSEKEIFIPALWTLTGYNQVPIKIRKLIRNETSYSFSKRVSLAVNAITSCSNRPLIYMFYIGSGIAFMSFILLLYLVYRRYFFDIPLAGWTSLMASIFLTGGMIIQGLGIIGLYISKIYTEVKNRPYDLIKEID